MKVERWRGVISSLRREVNLWTGNFPFLQRIGEGLFLNVPFFFNQVMRFWYLVQNLRWNLSRVCNDVIVVQVFKMLSCYFLYTMLFVNCIECLNSRIGMGIVISGMAIYRSEKFQIQFNPAILTTTIGNSRCLLSSRKRSTVYLPTRI